MMNFIILIVATVAAYIAWKLISRYFINKGHRKLIANFSGVSIALFTFLLTIAILAPKPEKSKEIENTSTIQKEENRSVAHHYTVVNSRDYSFPERKRIGWTITSPQAITKEDRALTTMQAAKDLQHSTNADQAEIFLVIDGLDNAHGMPLGLVVYAPDGKGNSGKIETPIWEVEISDQILTPLEKNIILAWYKNKKDFLKEDGLTDEQGLTYYIAKQLNIPIEQVVLPWISRVKMNYN